MSRACSTHEYFVFIGFERVDITGEYEQLHTEEFHSLYIFTSYSNRVLMKNSEVYIICMVNTNKYKVLVGKH
jgi:hypothetical protein